MLNTDTNADININIDSSKKYNSINFDNVINSILVNEGVRNACLIQPADYDEALGTDPRMSAIKEKIHSFFPDLIYSDEYDIYQGTIVSKKSYDGEEITLNRMGEILGYPCYEDFNTYDTNNDMSYFTSVMLQLMDKTTHEILVNVCKTNDKESMFQQIAMNAEAALKNPKYKNILDNLETPDGKIGVKIKRVYVTVEPSIPSKILIDRLIANQPFTEQETNALYNNFDDLSFSDEFVNSFETVFQFDNPLHRGIVLSLLLLVRNNPLSPFYPLQWYPGKLEEVNTVSHMFETEIMDTLIRTQSSAVESSVTSPNNFFNLQFVTKGFKNKNGARGGKTCKRRKAKK